MNIRVRIMDAWTNIARAEQEVFGDSLTFHSIEPYLRKLATGEKRGRSMTVDPKVYALAESFVHATLVERGYFWPKSKFDGLVQRAAQAMQQAIEDECEAIRKELQG